MVRPGCSSFYPVGFKNLQGWRLYLRRAVPVLDCSHGERVFHFHISGQSLSCFRLCLLTCTPAVHPFEELGSIFLMTSSYVWLILTWFELFDLINKAKIIILGDSVWRAQCLREQRKEVVQVPDFEHFCYCLCSACRRVKVTHWKKSVKIRAGRTLIFTT